MSPDEKPKILIVDDSKSIVDAEKKILEETGLQVITAYSGTEALRKISSEKPVMVFLDLMLPEINGDIICRYIKEKDDLKSISIIIVTAKDDPKQLQRCYQCGCDAYVVKPINRDDILEKTRLILSERGISIE